MGLKKRFIYHSWVWINLISQEAVQMSATMLINPGPELHKTLFQRQID